MGDENQPWNYSYWPSHTGFYQPPLCDTDTSYLHFGSSHEEQDYGDDLLPRDQTYDDEGEELEVRY